MASQDAGRALTHRLAGKPGTSIERYLLVEDLFLADAPQPYRPTVWHSLAWRQGSAPHYKVYLNPQAQGVTRAAEVVGEAMGRLGLADAWRPVAAQCAGLAQDGHQVEFFALDLGAHAEARAKVYFRHPEMDLAELGRVASLSRQHDPVRAQRAFDTVYGRTGGTVANDPMTCLAFRSDGSGADEANVYLRLPGEVASDVEAGERIADVMRSEGVAPRSYLDMLAELAPRSLDDSVGLQELLSFRTSHRVRADLGVYLRCSVYDTPVDAGQP